MDTNQTIEIFLDSAKLNPLVFFDKENWNTEKESLLKHHVYKILDILMPLGKSLNINFNIEVIDTVVSNFIIDIQNKFASNKDKLSVREAEVLNLIVQGCTNNEIAEKLFISFETVRSHRKNILAKTKTKNTASLLNYCHHALSDKKVFEIFHPIYTNLKIPL